MWSWELSWSLTIATHCHRIDFNANVFYKTKHNSFFNMNLSNNRCIFILNKYSQIYLILETIYTFMSKTAINIVRKSLTHQNHKLVSFFRFYYCSMFMKMLNVPDQFCLKRIQNWIKVLCKQGEAPTAIVSWNKNNVHHKNTKCCLHISCARVWGIMLYVLGCIRLNPG